MNLINDTTLPIHNIAQDSILAAFRAVDKVINEASILSRLAYIRLLTLTECLGVIIANEKQRNAGAWAYGRRNASLIYDIYMAAQDKPCRSRLHERSRRARRWRILAGPSPALLLIYSESAEVIV